jgi:hypothetical protein
MGHAVAKLRFQKLGRSSTGADGWGEITLYEDGTVRLSASDALKGRLVRTSERVDKAALMYGAGGFMAIAGIGTTLIVKRRTFLGYLFLVVAALLALGGSRVRTIAKTAPRVFDTAFERHDIVATIAEDGALTVTFTRSPWKGATFRFEPGEFNLSQAHQFIDALKTRSSRSESGTPA